MNIFELIERYGRGKGNSVLMESMEILSNSIEGMATPEEKNCIIKELYRKLHGAHYDEYFAKEQVEKMYFTDRTGAKRNAPYWTIDDVKVIYDKIKNKIPEAYNFWDFYVALNMIKSDSCKLIISWFPNATEGELSDKYAEMTANWLDDEDNPLGEGVKIWCYFNRA